MLHDNRLQRAITYSTWNGIYSSHSDFIAAPNSLSELQQVVSSYPGKIRCSGGNHTFNTLSLTDGLTLRTDNLQRILEINPLQQTATIEAGVTVTTLNEALAKQGLALPVQMATSKPALVGAAATAAHGSDISRSASFASLIQGCILILAGCIPLNIN